LKQYLIFLILSKKNSEKACLPLPQFWSNYQKKDTRGLSYGLIGSWFLGDLFKTTYFVTKNQPFQFILCGIFQLIVDSSIIGQMFLYTKSDKKI